MSPKENFKRFLPESVYIDFDHQEELLELLYQNSWIPASDKIVSVEKPGEGNMNFVLRVKTNSTSIVIKQSRPWVEKYPQIPAPENRIAVEATFYQEISNDNFFHRYCPAIIGFDKKNYVLALEDLGEATDCTFVYKKNSTLEDKDLESLVGFISHLHNSSIGYRKTFPENAELKILNHTHIFKYPFQEDNGFTLDAIQPGLQAASIPYKKNSILKENIVPLGDVYLQTHQTLIHGDFYPGSWLRGKTGIKIIDPEFSHFGRAEFDLGVMMAHLKMAQVESRALTNVLELYGRPQGFDNQLFCGFCGVEIMRRIIGLAQLPFDLNLKEKSALLELARQLIITKKETPLFK
ncbi:MAG: aminoglycoside phosphotransferase [Bacteroidia bacterium]|nr:aminoglycoside phosphotransferase [Bacteroidia bacterium]